jgi:hypothetical protein
MDQQSCGHSHTHSKIRISPPSASLPQARGSTAIMIGDAGVHLVMSRLLGWQIPVRDAPNGQPYDIIADVKGAGMLRLQVKTTTKVKGGKLNFRMQRGFYRSKHGIFDYDESDFDIAAFVYLPECKLLFWAWPPRTVSVPLDDLDSPAVARRTWMLALKHYSEARNKRTIRVAFENMNVSSPSASSPFASPESMPNSYVPAGPYRTFFTDEDTEQ